VTQVEPTEPLVVYVNHIIVVIVGVHSLSVVHHGFEPCEVKPKTIILIFDAYSLSIVFLLTVISVSYNYKDPAKHVGLVQSGHHHHLIECNLFIP
jgi:hypothetical protein